MVKPKAFPGAPRWVRAFAIGALVLILLVAALMIAGVAGKHGPGRHFASDRGPEKTSTDSTKAAPGEVADEARTGQDEPHAGGH